MMNEQKIRNARGASRWIFLVCGLAISSWAPMVPFTKERLGLNDADLGILLLVLGMGAMIMMPLSGFLMARFGSRRIIALGTLLTVLTLPLLPIISSFSAMFLTLFIFGCGIGTVDVAMNAQGVQVQNLYGRPIMSSLHGLFSVGGLAGSLGLGVLLKAGLNLFHAALTVAIFLVILLLLQYRHLFNNAMEKEIIKAHTLDSPNGSGRKRLGWLQGSILLLGFMCFTTFLSEGAMLDWSAVFLREVKNVSAELAGVGYACFSVAMAVMRLTGDKIVERVSQQAVVVGGSLTTAAGVLMVILAPGLALSLLGFVLVGVGASNIVPIFFSESGKVKGVSPTTSIAAITTMGYAGQLVGPAMLGFVAFRFSLEAAFGLVAFLMVLVAAAYFFKRK